MRRIIKGSVDKANTGGGGKANKFASRLKRIANQQTTHDIEFETKTSAATTYFEDSVSALPKSWDLLCKRNTTLTSPVYISCNVRELTTVGTFAKP